jgi:hypothetical protein
MFVDSDLMNVWNILEIRTDLNKGYGYIGQDIRFMLGTTSWIFLRQEGKKLFNKHMKYNLFYSNAIGAVIYVPAFMCRDFSKCEGYQLNKRIPNYNHSSTEHRILNEKAFDYQYQEKIQIILDRETESLLNCGEKKQAEINELEEQAKIAQKLQMEENELRYTEALEQFEAIADDFSTELSLLLKKYKVELYYNSCDEDTNIKYNGEELNIAITDLVE